MTTPEQNLKDRLQALVAVYQDARARPGCPATHLDWRLDSARHEVVRVINTDWMCRQPIERHQAYERAGTILDKLEAEFIQWRDMPAGELSGRTAQIASPGSGQSYVAIDHARLLYDDLSRRGIRIEVGSRGRMSVRPARNLTEIDKRELVNHKAALAAIWKQRNDVWIVE